MPSAAVAEPATEAEDEANKKRWEESGGSTGSSDEWCALGSGMSGNVRCMMQKADYPHRAVTRLLMGLFRLPVVHVDTTTLATS